MVNLSSAMAVQFAAVVKEMTEQVQKMGPNPLRDGQKEAFNG